MLRHSYPDSKDLEDLRTGITKFVLAGFVPERPLFNRKAQMVTMGSCFAGTIHEAFVKAGIASTHVFLSETMNTPPFALITVQSLRGKDPTPIGHLGPNTLDENSVAEMRKKLMEASAFILTLGVALQPFEEDGKPVFHITKSMVKGWSKNVLRGDSWRMLSVDEILNYTRSTIDGVRSLRPDIPVIITLSPIPLHTSAYLPSPVVQDCISKSFLRTAIAMLMEEGIENLFYWPSFEIVRWLGGHVGPFFGVDGDQRHLKPECLDLITDLFVQHYFDQ